MEQTSDTVLMGKIIDAGSYERKEKAIDIDESIVIDWLDEKSGVIHEVKKSDSMEEAHRWQVLYYLWYLKQKGVEGLKGEIDYPKLKQKVTIELTPDDEHRMLGIHEAIETVVNAEKPPDKNTKKFCKTCSYFELCWVE